jgi:hypothetical protein
MIATNFGSLVGVCALDSVCDLRLPNNQTPVHRAADVRLYEWARLLVARELQLWCPQERVNRLTLQTIKRQDWSDHIVRQPQVHQLVKAVKPSGLTRSRRVFRCVCLSTGTPLAREGALQFVQAKPRCGSAEYALDEESSVKDRAFDPTIQ